MRRLQDFWLPEQFSAAVDSIERIHQRMKLRSRSYVNLDRIIHPSLSQAGLYAFREGRQGGR